MRLLAGGPRRRPTFFAGAKKVSKENEVSVKANLQVMPELKHTPQPSKPRDFRTRPGGERTRFAQTPFADIPRPRPEITAPSEGGRKPVRGYSVCYCIAVDERVFSNTLLRRRFFRRCSGELGEHCLSPQGELRSRPNSAGKIGNPKGGEAGCAFFGSFLCTSKERNWPPGHSRLTCLNAQPKRGWEKTWSVPYCCGAVQQGVVRALTSHQKLATLVLKSDRQAMSALTDLIYDLLSQRRSIDMDGLNL
jgi:hypothetical protein